MSESSDLIDMREVARITGRSYETVRRWRKMGTGPRLARIGGRVMARRSEVEAWINAQFGDAA